ncbi:glycosyltransferase family 4 protein [soil metagenome]
MKVALVYDRVNKWGGAERVLLALHELFPDAPLYTSVYNAETAPWAKVFTVRTSFLQHFPFAKSSHELYALFMPLVFESFSFDEFDTVISITSEAAKGIITKPGTRHICYCLTPTRYLWSGYSEYFANYVLKFVSFPLISYLRFWDKISGSRPDQFVAISREVQKRISTYYKKDAVVIYPPVTLGTRYKVDTKAKKKQKQDYFLIVSRLVSYKRIDLAIEACNRLKLPLKIVGTGMQEEYLKSIAGETIEFLGRLTDEQIIGYYCECTALLFPGSEDFGLTILEAQSFGKPVIAYKAGGALETIREGKTGEFFFPQTSAALERKLEKFKQNKYNSRDSIDQAKKFDKKQFFKQMQAILTNK